MNVDQITAEFLQLLQVYRTVVYKRARLSRWKDFPADDGFIVVFKVVFLKKRLEVVTRDFELGFDRTLLFFVF
jgi:hypothetical protein